MKSTTKSSAHDDLSAFIQRPGFPCVGARAALSRQGLTTIDGGLLEHAEHDQTIVAALQKFTREVRDDAMFVSVAVVFSPTPACSEPVFERALWQRLQAWHQIDRQQYEWDPRVSSDPSSPTFSMSIGGQAFYVIGLHPGASRRARRFHRPALVLNLHRQFERLRADGRYDKLRAAITERDVALSGSSNPMLAVHGESSEARQYSGRQVDADWTCPFDTACGDRHA
ncbi:MAG: guanitoxin biosynthesis heme-dependent pre-guanitoxin N-hydroxylase GntA [Rhodanobacter sp.]